MHLSMVDERYLAIVIGVDACGLLIPSLRRPRWVASTEVLIPPPCFTCQKGCITRSEGKRDEAKRKDSGCHTTTQTDRIVCLLFNVCYLLFLFFFLMSLLFFFFVVSCFSSSSSFCAGACFWCWCRRWWQSWVVGCRCCLRYCWWWWVTRGASVFLG